MAKPNIDHWAQILNSARLGGHSIPQLSKDLRPFERSDAYAIQEQQLSMRVLAGESQVGWKMGLTSEAKRRQMNLDSPLYGFLMNSMQVPAGGVFPLKGSIHPKIEPEVAFRIDTELLGAVTREQVLEACGGVAACMEILDSRYEHFKYFSMEDVIADNASSSHFVMGKWFTDFRSLDLRALEMRMQVDGKTVQSGLSSDISGDPVISVVQLCALLAERGAKLAAGSIVLAGAATPAVELKAGMKVQLTVTGLPEVSIGIGF